jgi:anaerobic magnesium-protoporphyrin IX monomethyl ester cyclase
MKITLISPYQDIRAFGLRCVSACLKRAGHQVTVIFLPHPFTRPYATKTLNQVVELCGESGLVGISLMSNYFDNSVQLTEALKKSLTMPIAWGGVHPTIRPHECLNHTDIVCVGEGEEALVQLAGRMESDEPYHDIHGLWFKDGSRIVANPLRPLIQDLDALPFQDQDYETHYLLRGDDVLPADAGSLSPIYPSYLTMSSRGCPFGCTYCLNNTLNRMYSGQRIIRKRSINNTIDEICEAVRKMPFLNRVKLEDDIFLLAYSSEEIADFCRQYRSKIGLPLAVSGVSPSTLSEEKLSLLMDAGLMRIRLGIQTASERTRKLYKRRYTNSQVEKAAKMIHKVTDRVGAPTYDIILDNPWESEADLIETLLFLSKLPPPFSLQLFSLNFFPETELYRRAKQEGIIKDDLQDVYRKHYLRPRKTYVNGLFVLLDRYASAGFGIPPRVMAFLTDSRVRKLGLHWALYGFLKALSLLMRFKVLSSKALGVVRRGEWNRINIYLKNLLSGS